MTLFHQGVKNIISHLTKCQNGKQSGRTISYSMTAQTNLEGPCTTLLL